MLMLSCQKFCFWFDLSRNEGVSCGCHFSRLLNSSHCMCISAACFFFLVFFWNSEIVSHPTCLLLACLVYNISFFKKTPSCVSLVDFVSLPSFSFHDVADFNYGGRYIIQWNYVSDFRVQRRAQMSEWLFLRAGQYQLYIYIVFVVITFCTS